MDPVVGDPVSADCKRGRRKGATSKNIKNRQKVSKSFSTLFDNFRAGQKTSKIVKKCQKVFRHFSTIFARHLFSGPFCNPLTVRQDTDLRYEHWKVVSPPSAYFIIRNFRMYICILCSLVVISSNWVCDNWVHQIPRMTFRAAGKSGRVLPAASKFARKPLSSKEFRTATPFRKFSDRQTLIDALSGLLADFLTLIDFNARGPSSHKS